MSTTHAGAIIAADAVFMVVAIAAVSLRFYARRRNSTKVAADDWLIVIALCFSIALTITNILGVSLGYFGTPFESLSDDDLVGFIKVFFAVQFFYICAAEFVKLSVLYFYKRIFAVAKTPLVISVFIAISICWLVFFFFATLFQIHPIWCNWLVCQRTANYPAMYISSSATDMLLDVSILCLPAFFIRNLQMSLTKKIGIASIFGLRIFCVVASTARLVYTVHFMRPSLLDDLPSNFDVSVDNIILWSGIGACVSTACACLPCYGSLLLKGWRGRSGGWRQNRSGISSERYRLGSLKSIKHRIMFIVSSGRRPTRLFGNDSLRQHISEEENDSNIDSERSVSHAEISGTDSASCAEMDGMSSSYS